MLWRVQLTKLCRCDSDYICELLKERAILERILGNASKADKLNKEKKRTQLAELFEAIKNNKTEVMSELELLRKDAAKVRLLYPKHRMR